MLNLGPLGEVNFPKLQQWLQRRISKFCRFCVGFAEDFEERATAVRFSFVDTHPSAGTRFDRAHVRCVQEAPGKMAEVVEENIPVSPAAEPLDVCFDGSGAKKKGSTSGMRAMVAIADLMKVPTPHRPLGRPSLATDVTDLFSGLGLLASGDPAQSERWMRARERGKGAAMQRLRQGGREGG